MQERDPEFSYENRAFTGPVHFFRSLRMVFRSPGMVEWLCHDLHLNTDSAHTEVPD